MTCFGSSPRLRGTGLKGPDKGLINAVHPRACGERGNALVINYLTHGSSPRLRGTGNGCSSRWSCTGFIPAPAGNGCRSLPARPSSTVHPRACGERSGSSCVVTRSCGSSPRLRGTDRRPRRLPGQRRFIPAPAGNGARDCTGFGFLPVHPRACGERGTIEAECDQCGGSSPRLRGTVVRIQCMATAIRFIPAPAGNGSTRPSIIAPLTVHPRACGERSIITRRRTLATGSSPRLRGTGVLVELRTLQIRFIPAPAGNGR